MKILNSIIFIVGVLSANAQSDFTLEEYLAEVLVKDYGILIVKNSAIVAENNNNIGNAGYLPTIVVNADQNWTISNARQEFLSGQVNDVKGANNRAMTVGAALNWTFFDGFKMFATDKKLDLLQESAQLNLRAEMEMKLYQASISFYTLLLLKDMNSLYEESIDFSLARYNQIKTKVDKGAASQVELVQTRLDLTADSAALLNNQRSIATLQASLNAMIARDPLLPFNAVGDFPVFSETLTWEQLKSTSMENNSSLLYAKAMVAISEQERKEVISNYYPQLSFYAGYNYGNSQNEVGFLLSSRTSGPQFGLSLKWDILNRLSRIQDSKNSKIFIENSQLFQEQRSLAIQAELRDAFLTYEWARKNYEFEERNQFITEEVAAIKEQAFNSGALTQLELREFQFAIINTKNRMVNAKMEYITGLLNVRLLSGEMGK